MLKLDDAIFLLKDATAAVWLLGRCLMLVRRAERAIDESSRRLNIQSQEKAIQIPFIRNRSHRWYIEHIGRYYYCVSICWKDALDRVPGH